MTSQFSPKVSEILAYSREEAARLASQSVAPEHLLIAILRGDESDINDFFEQMNVDKATLKQDLEERVRREEQAAPINARELVMNEDASNVMRRAILEASLYHSVEVEVKHSLLAILHDQMPNGAKELLEQTPSTTHYREQRAITPENML